MLCVNKFVMEIKEETHLILPSDQTHYPITLPVNSRSNYHTP